MTYASFKKQWNGKRVDFDHVYGYQCVDLTEQYCYQLGVTGVYGNAIDYATNPSPNFKKHFTRVSNYKQGDIVVLKATSSSPFGHIGILDHTTTGNVWLLEQNATGTGTGTGKSAIGVWRAIPTSHVAAIWRPNANITPPAPTPAYPRYVKVVIPQLNVRSGAGTNYPLAGSKVLHQGDVVLVTALVTGQNVAGNNKWYRSRYGNYFWSGGAK